MPQKYEYDCACGTSCGARTSEEVPSHIGKQLRGGLRHLESPRSSGVQRGVSGRTPTGCRQSCKFAVSGPKLALANRLHFGSDACRSITIKTERRKQHGSHQLLERLQLAQRNPEGPTPDHELADAQHGARRVVHAAVGLLADQCQPDGGLPPPGAARRHPDAQRQLPLINRALNASSPHTCAGCLRFLSHRVPLTPFGRRWEY